MIYLFRRIDSDVLFVCLFVLFFCFNFEVPLSWLGVIHFIWCASPLITLYFLSRMLLSPIVGFYFTCVTAIVLNIVNFKKSALTGMALSSSDLFATSNFSVVLKYVNTSSLLFLIFAVFIFLLLIFNAKKKRKSKIFNCVGICALLMSLSPYYSAFGDDNFATNRYGYILDRLGLRYISWNWEQNIDTNGLYYHLIQTSVRVRPRESTVIDRSQVVAFNSKTDSETHPRKIIFILCEACWYDENNFKNEFSYLSELGFSSSRGLSPLYGGGTANAEFEILTGLPSYNSSLTGVIYQEYASLFRDETETLARVLVRNGYSSIALHNNVGKFWRRDVVYRKFGFQEFISIEKMGMLPEDLQKGRKPWQWQPDDYLLYESALRVIKKNKDNKLFLHMITMSTHGPYEYEHDYGEGHYKTQLIESAVRMRNFIEKAQKIDPDTLFFIYGDHKPAMNRFFYNRGVLNRDVFLKTGTADTDFIFNERFNPKQYGDIPIFIKYKSRRATDEVLKSLKGMPFYCISKKINEEFIKVKFFSYNDVSRNGICNVSNSYDKNLSDELDDVYSKMLF
ncbi:hypothetical protein C5B78_07235 [Aeromonas salmonicida]|uniref:LTA synthase family protein n=1 Tax=Aeromonas salmonicida TaxID=645 RepID=UPI000F791B9F|nr:LTA synthase family protein [Aeromonas salmonicida]RSM29425.1 hypothetical protein C5B78_07235 [Aeromonas salmonicida]